MHGLLFDAFTILAQAAPGAAGKPEPQSQLMQYLPLVPIPFIFYFMLIRPQQQQEKKRREMMNQLKKNDKVVTAAGMYGTVISVDEEGDKVQLRLDDDGRVKITFTRASIVRVLNDSPGKSPDRK